MLSLSAGQLADIYDQSTRCEHNLKRLSGWGPTERAEKQIGEIILFDGSVIIASGAQVTGSVYMLGGDLRLDGAVAGDISLIDVRLTLGPDARVGSFLPLLIAVIALGAALLTRFGTRTFVPALESSAFQPWLREN